MAPPLSELDELEITQALQADAREAPGVVVVDLDQESRQSNVPNRHAPGLDDGARRARVWPSFDLAHRARSAAAAAELSWGDRPSLDGGCAVSS